MPIVPSLQTTEMQFILPRVRVCAYRALGKPRNFHFLFIVVLSTCHCFGLFVTIMALKNGNKSKKWEWGWEEWELNRWELEGMDMLKAIPAHL